MSDISPMNNTTFRLPPKRVLKTVEQVAVMEATIQRLKEARKNAIVTVEPPVIEGKLTCNECKH